MTIPTDIENLKGSFAAMTLPVTLMYKLDLDRVMTCCHTKTGGQQAILFKSYQPETENLSFLLP